MTNHSRPWRERVLFSASKACGGLLLLGLIGSAPPTIAAEARQAGALQLVAEFPHQVTGVAVTTTGRIFVNFPRWTEDTAISVAELKPDGRLIAYPDAGWNAWRNAGALSPEHRFVCVQSVVSDHGSLFIVDPGAPAIGTLVKGAPKLVQVDLATDRVIRVIPFGEDVAPQGSYLNDIRFTPDGRFGFLSDAGARGATVVVDLAAGTARRVLDGAPSNQAEPGFKVKVDEHPLQRPDGRPAVFNSDGITVAADGGHVYWQALNGRALYRLPTGALTDAGLPATTLAAQVERVGPTRPSDGLWTDADDRIFFTTFESNAVTRRDMDGSFHVVVRDPRLRWPDSMAEGADGSLYVTASHIQDSPWFKPGALDRVVTQLWRIPGAMRPRPRSPVAVPPAR